MLVDIESYTANACGGEAVVIVLVGAPVAKGRARVTRHGIAYTPRKTRQYERALGFQALAAMRGRVPITGPVRVAVEITLPVPASWAKKKRVDAISGRLSPTSGGDIDNHVKAALDGITPIVIRDDGQVTQLAAVKAYGSQPQIRITVEPLLDSRRSS